MTVATLLFSPFAKLRAGSAAFHRQKNRSVVRRTLRHKRFHRSLDGTLGSMVRARSGEFNSGLSKLGVVSERRLAAEIPADSDGMKSATLGLACRRRTETRRIFHTYFAAGYRVTGFARDACGSGRCFYVMTRSSPGA
ncbi:MAG: hypothetical protein ACRD1O_09890 [Terriglobia bacterium]